MWDREEDNPEQTETWEGRICICKQQKRQNALNQLSASVSFSSIIFLNNIIQRKQTNSLLFFHREQRETLFVNKDKKVAPELKFHNESNSDKCLQRSAIVTKLDQDMPPS